MEWKPAILAKARPAGLGLLLLLAPLAYAQQPKASAAAGSGLQETGSYLLTMDKIRRLAAAAGELSVYGRSHPDSAQDEQHGSGQSGPASFTAMAAELDAKRPDVAALIKSHGFSTREYLVAAATPGLASMAVGMKKSGIGGATARTAHDSNPVVGANEELVEKNWDEVRSLTSAVDGPGGGQRQAHPPAASQDAPASGQEADPEEDQEDQGQ